MVGNRIPDFGGSLIGGIPRAAFNGIKDAMTSAIRGAAGSTGGGSGPDSAWEPSAGAEQRRQMMIDAYKNQGYEPTPAKIDAWVRQIRILDHASSCGEGQCRVSTLTVRSGQLARNASIIR